MGNIDLMYDEDFVVVIHFKQFRDSEELGEIAVRWSRSEQRFIYGAASDYDIHDADDPGKCVHDTSEEMQRKVKEAYEKGQTPTHIKYYDDGRGKLYMVNHPGAPVLVYDAYDPDNSGNKARLSESLPEDAQSVGNG